MKYLSFKYIILASFGFAIALSACNKDPNVKNEYEDWKNPDNANTGGGPELDVNSIQGIHFHIFKPTCSNSGCHDGTFEPDFRTVESSYNSLVNNPVIKADSAVPGQFMLRVEPGNADNSMLLRRCRVDLGGNSGTMPLSIDPGNDWLDRKDEYLARIEKWINDGAKDQFGNAVPPKDLKPQMAGMVVKAGATTFSRSGNYNPVDVPAGTGNITVYFSYIDDKTPQAQFTSMTADTSQNPGLFVNSGQFTMTKLGSALNMTGLFGLDLDYWHSISLNISAYQPGQVIWFKTTVSDNVNATIEIPSAFSSFNNQKYFAIRIN
jgi:hypothetical protein